MIHLPRQENLRRVARFLEISVGELEALNPELRRGLTPPSKEPYALRIPKGSSEKIKAALARKPAPVYTAATKHIVQPGDTLSMIARQYGVSLEALLMLNNHLEPRRLMVGTQVAIPRVTRQK